MPRFLAKLCLLLFCACARPGAGFAGAFMVPEGYGQFIAGVASSEGSRRFDKTGRAQPTPAYRKVLVDGYLEFGATPWLTLVAAPTMSRQNGVATNQVTGSDGSAFGARVALAQGPGQVVSLQALVQPPLGGDRESQLASGGARSAALDLRLQIGKSFTIGVWPGFVDVDPGVRLRADPLPNEARLDLTFGLRPIPRWLILCQDFLSVAPSRGAAVERTAYSKLQVSVVFDVSPAWSVQVGGFRTISGTNAIREAGPIFALWHRF